jgi:hypothetical protein
LLLLLLLLWLLDVCRLELRSVGITLYLPLASLVLLELALLVEFGEKVLGLEGLLRLSLLDCKLVLKLFVLALKFNLTLFFAQFIFLQISELGSSTSAF